MLIEVTAFIDFNLLLCFIVNHYYHHYNDYNKLVQKIVSSGLGVWVSTQGSPTIRLYHATTYENLADIDVSPAVNKMLAGKRILSTF